MSEHWHNFRRSVPAIPANLVSQRFYRSLIQQIINTIFGTSVALSATALGLAVNVPQEGENIKRLEGKKK